MQFRIILSIILISLLFAGCQKNVDEITGGPFPVLFVKSTLYGVVTGTDGKGLSGVQVISGNQIKTTDENGYFFLPEATLDANGTMVNFNAPGYFSITKTISPLANTRTAIEVQLTPRQLSGTIQALTGGSITIQNAEVILPANGFVTAQGQPYSGAVRVYGLRLDPEDADMQRRMPGNLTAIREDGRAAVLATFGMIGVELESATGAPLQLAPGATAELRVPLSPAYAAAAPATIPLWHFDNAKGRWIEEGEATLQGAIYIGKVNHFSFWNLDIPYDLVRLSGKVLTEGGQPLQGIYVSATIKSGGGSNLPPGSFAYATTGPDGSFTGMVPEGAVLDVKVISDCGDLTSGLEVGPLTSDFDMGTILVEWDDIYLEVTGILHDCNGNLLAPPSYVLLEVGGKNHLVPVASDGTIETVLIKCQATELNARAIDVPNLKQGTLENYAISGNTNLDLGILEACDQLEEFIEFDLGGNEKLLVDVYGSVQGSILTISGNAPDSNAIYLQLPIIVPGTTAPSYLHIVYVDEVMQNFINVYCTSCPTMEVTLDIVGQVGEMITGSFTGTVTDSQANDHTLTGSFRVRRTQ